MMSSIPSSFDPLGTSNAIILPPGYTRVNYLESTGSQHLELGNVPVSYEVGVDFSFSCDPTQTASALYGFYLETSQGHSRRISAFAGKDSLGLPLLEFVNDMLREGYDTFYPQWNPNDKLRIVHNYKMSREGFISVNEEVIGRAENLTNSVDYKTSWLFCVLTRYTPYGWYESKLKAKLYNCKVSIGENEWRNLIPVLDPTNRPCMFDLVTKTPFYNKGAGEFLYG